MNERSRFSLMKFLKPKELPKVHTHTFKKSRRTTLRESYRNTMKGEITTLRWDSNFGQKQMIFEMIRNEPPIRGALNVIVNASTSNGGEFTTLKKTDNETEDWRIAFLEEYTSNPLRRTPFIKVIRDLAHSIVSYDLTFAELTDNKGNKDKKWTNGTWLYPLDTRDCELMYSSEGKQVIGLYHQVKNDGGAKETTLGLNDFVHISMNGMGSEIGLSPLEALVDSATLNMSSRNYNINLFETNGVPATATILEEGSYEDFEITKAALDSTGQGDSVLLKGKIKMVLLGGKANEMGYKDLVSAVYQDVMSVFNIPPHLLSYTQGGGTQQSSRDTTNSFSMTIKTIQSFIEWIINFWIVSKFGNNFSDIRYKLRGWIDEKAQSAIDDVYLSNGVYVPNDILRRKGMPLKQYGELPYFVNYVPQYVLYERDGVDAFDLTPEVADDKPDDQASGQKPELERPSSQDREKKEKTFQDQQLRQNQVMINGLYEQNRLLKDIVSKYQVSEEYFIKEAQEYSEGDNKVENED